MFKLLRKLFKRYIDSNYQGWDISIAIRYLPIVEDIKRDYQPKETILEVGSEITGITPYLKMKVTGLDLDFDYSRRNKYLEPIEGSALSLPFENESFDYVLSVDMLEHLPDDKRHKAISEMVRVASKKVYLSFPCGKEATIADLELNRYYLEKRGEDYPYLKEHVVLGLPDCAKVKQLLENIDKAKLRILNNTNIILWIFLLKLGLSGEKFKSSLYRRLLLFLPLLKYCNFGPTYRKLFILQKE